MHRLRDEQGRIVDDVVFRRRPGIASTGPPSFARTLLRGGRARWNPAAAKISMRHGVQPYPGSRWRRNPGAPSSTRADVAHAGDAAGMASDLTMISANCAGVRQPPQRLDVELECASCDRQSAAAPAHRTTPARSAHCSAFDDLAGRSSCGRRSLSGSSQMRIANNHARRTPAHRRRRFSRANCVLHVQRRVVGNDRAGRATRRAR